MARSRQLTKQVVYEAPKTTRKERRQPDVIKNNKQIAELFFKHNYVKGLASATQKQYRQVVTYFLNWYNKPLLETTAEDIDNYLLYRKTECNGTDSYLRTIAKHLKVFFNYCYTMGYCGNVVVTIPKVEATIKEAYTTEELTALLAKPQSNNWVEWRTWCMVNYFYGTGQRLSTVTHIKRKHLDLDRGIVFLEWNKDKIQKFMPLSSAVIEALRIYLNLTNLDKEDYLFPDAYDNKMLTTRAVEDSIIKYNHKRGVAKTSVHLFRHAFARDFIQAGGSPAKLQKLLNHKTIEMSMHYVDMYAIDIANDIDIYNPLVKLQHDNRETTRLHIVREA